MARVGNRTIVERYIEAMNAHDWNAMGWRSGHSRESGYADETTTGRSMKTIPRA